DFKMLEELDRRCWHKYPSRRPNVDQLLREIKKMRCLGPKRIEEDIDENEKRSKSRDPFRSG
ncbi:4227_t:CDS:1, partial [Ambispora leptoticha]